MNPLDLVVASDFVTGLEKESLRVDLSGKIAQTPHPLALGSALTNAYITTDYSEALLELITQPLPSAKETIDSLADIHRFVYGHLDNELLWACSMPPRITAESEIPIAYYGKSNLGQIKHIYRQGLAHRYGRRMQSIAGIHFNFSLSDHFWHKWYQESGTGNAQSLRQFIDQKYLGLVRNYFRQSWLLLQLFGASPAIDASFIEKMPESLHKISDNTWIGDYATSLRMSNIGYVNNTQSQVGICYNDLNEYVNGLRLATSTVEPLYADIGIKDENGQYKQLNDNILQIEAEYYSPIRPKRKAHRDERPVTALAQRGIDYIEVRSLDLNPFEVIGISETDIYFLDLFLLHCLFTPSAGCDSQEAHEYRENKLQIAYQGRKPGLNLVRNGTAYPLTDWIEEIFLALQPIAGRLDKDTNSKKYSAALQKKRHLLRNPDTLPSARFLAVMNEKNLSFVEAGLLLSEGQKNELASRELSKSTFDFFAATAEKSLQDQQMIEETDTESLDAYLQRYLKS